MDQWYICDWADVLAWKLSPVVFYSQLKLRNTTGLSFQPDGSLTSLIPQ